MALEHFWRNSGKIRDWSHTGDVTFDYPPLGCFPPTSSPGSSHFSIWRQLGRRPWHTADHVTKTPTSMEIQNGGYGEKGEKIWVEVWLR